MRSSLKRKIQLHQYEYNMSSIGILMEQYLMRYETMQMRYKSQKS